MSDEYCAELVKAEVESLIKSGTITQDNYSNMSFTSKLVSNFQKAHEADKFKRPKVNKFLNQYLNEYFTSPQPTADDDNNDNSTTDDENIENENIDNNTENTETDNNSTENENTATPPPIANNTNNNNIVNQLEMETVATPTTSSRRRRGGAASTTSRTATLRTTKTTSENTNEDSRLKYSMCKNMNIDNPYSAYNIKEPKVINKLPDDANIDDAEEELVKYITNNDDITDKYLTARDDFIENAKAIRQKYPIFDEKQKEKPQKFSITKKSVKFIDPTTKKQAELPAEDAAIFKTYQEAMDEFDKSWKEALKPVKIPPGKTPQEKAEVKQLKAAEHIKPLNYLTLSVVRTQNIIKIDSLIKHSKADFEETNKTTNTVNKPLDDMAWKKMEDTSKYKPFAPDYALLFVDIKKFNGSNYGRLCKTIYNHREPIVKHEKLTKDLKMSAWLQAYSNIKEINSLISIDDKEQRLVYDCWENVLGSKYAYKIVMNYLPACEMFKKSFELLIQHPLSVKLYETALYPISFVFTPNMLGKRDFEANINCFNKTVATYKRNLQIEMEKFGLVSNNASNYNDFNWLYYFNKSDIRNQMITLLHQAVALVDTPTETKKKSETTADTDKQ